MRLRVLLSGLGFFITALVIAWGPVAASAHGAVPKCTIVGTNGPDFLLGTSRKDVICGLRRKRHHRRPQRKRHPQGRHGRTTGSRATPAATACSADPATTSLYGYDGARDWLDGGTGYDRGYRDRTLDSIKNVERYPGL